MYNLFNQFEIISYKGVPVRNLLTRITFSDLVKKTGAVFYPYVVADGERPDNIASHYYNDPRYSWLVYMSNNIFDPYHDWPLTQLEFDEFIIEKYGSKEAAMRKIVFWRDNWRSDDTVKNTAGYNALASEQKKYFSPITGYGGAVVSYVRTPSDKIIETNKIVKIEVSSTTIFNIGDHVLQRSGGNIVFQGEVKSVQSSEDSIYVNNARGTGAATPIEKLDGTSAAFVSTNTISQPLPSSESIYWEPVDALTYEDELNISKRTIRLIDRSFIDQIERELDELL